MAARGMRGTAVDDEIHRAHALQPQRAHAVDEHWRAECAMNDTRHHPAASGECRDHRMAVALPRCADDGCLPYGGDTRSPDVSTLRAHRIAPSDHRALASRALEATTADRVQRWKPSVDRCGMLSRVSSRIRRAWTGVNRAAPVRRPRGGASGARKPSTLSCAIYAFTRRTLTPNPAAAIACVMPARAAFAARRRSWACVGGIAAVLR